MPTTIAIIAGVIILFLIIVALRPSAFSVTRSATIGAPPEAVFVQVNDLHKWEDWSPWAKVDPNAKTYYEGPPAGEGAAYGWSGNNKIGEGKMTITASRPAELVQFRLEFFRPMKGTNTAEFTFKPDGNRTVVTWTMSGKMGFMGKLFGMFMNCEKMISGQFDKGLADMKSIVESAPKPSPAMSHA
jgi:hypothetical protein